MRIEKYVAELLFENNCVIIPGFGGFVTSVFPAEFSPAGLLCPPYKKLAFNASLKANDGLLGAYIAKKEKVTYQEALVNIEVFVKELQKELETKKVVLENIGELHYDQERNLQFTVDKSVNYLTGSFGLHAVTIASVVTSSQPDVPVIPINSGKSWFSRKWKVAAVAVPFALGLGLFAISGSDIKTGINYSSFNPLTLFSTSSSQVEVSPVKVVMASKRAAEEINSGSTVPAEGATESIVVEEVVETKVAAPAPNVDANYFIIGGCFSIPENASAFSEELREEGYEALILETRGGLTPVAYRSFTSVEQAREELQKIRSINPDAWLLKK